MSHLTRLRSTVVTTKRRYNAVPGDISKGTKWAFRDAPDLISVADRDTVYRGGYYLVYDQWGNAYRVTNERLYVWR
jgi:hypothetical protein